MDDDAGATAPRTVKVRWATLLVALLALAAGLQAPLGPEPAAAQGPPAEGVASNAWRVLSAGGDFSCGVQYDGRLWCWGGDAVGQLGNGTDGPLTSPTQAAGRRTDWVAVDAGETTACALRRSGRLFCWGFDGAGQLGNDALTASRPAPVEVAGGQTWSSVSVGAEHTCARRTDGRLFCWGSDADGQLGNGPTLTGNRPTPVQVAGGVTTWTSVSVGNRHTCARRQGGRLFCWGDDGFGQLGRGMAGADRPSPVQVVGNRTDWTGPVATGAAHTCARRTNGSLFCWGSDTSGQLGNGPTGSSATPVEAVSPGDALIAVTAGAQHTCAVTDERRLYCTGANNAGELGSAGGPATILREVSGLATDWVTVTGGMGHTCATRLTAQAYCWGANGAGQLGNGQTVPSAQPREVLILTT